MIEWMKMARAIDDRKQAQQAEVDRLRLALLRITRLGAVCENFMECDHRSCRDSCAAHLIALEALEHA